MPQDAQACFLSARCGEKAYKEAEIADFTHLALL